MDSASDAASMGSTRPQDAVHWGGNTCLCDNKVIFQCADMTLAPEEEYKRAAGALTPALVPWCGIRAGAL